MLSLLCRLIVMLLVELEKEFMGFVAQSDTEAVWVALCVPCPGRPCTIAEPQRAPTSGGMQPGPRKASSSATTQGRVFEDFVAVSEISWERESLAAIVRLYTHQVFNASALCSANSTREQVDGHGALTAITRRRRYVGDGMGNSADEWPRSLQLSETGSKLFWGRDALPVL